MRTFCKIIYSIGITSCLTALILLCSCSNNDDNIDVAPVNADNSSTIVEVDNRFPSVPGNTVATEISDTNEASNANTFGGFVRNGVYINEAAGLAIITPTNMKTNHADQTFEYEVADASGNLRLYAACRGALSDNLSAHLAAQAVEDVFVQGGLEDDISTMTMTVASLPGEAVIFEKSDDTGSMCRMSVFVESDGVVMEFSALGESRDQCFALLQAIMPIDDPNLAPFYNPEFSKGHVSGSSYVNKSMNLSAEFPAKYTLSEPEEIECLAENDTTEKVTVTVGYMGTHEDYDDYFNGLYEYETPQYGSENVSQETITFAGVQCRALVYSHDDKLSKLVL